MNKSAYWVALCLFLALGSCSAPRKTAGKDSAPRAACESIPFGSGESRVGWWKTTPEAGAQIDRNIPVNAQYYRLDTAALMRNFEYLAHGGNRFGFSVPLPAPLGCQYFQIDRNLTPAGASGGFIFEGHALSDDSATIRIVSQRTLAITIRWDGETYYRVAPVQSAQADYAVYQLFIPAHRLTPEAEAAIRKRSNFLHPSHSKQDAVK